MVLMGIEFTINSSWINSTQEIISYAIAADNLHAIAAYNLHAIAADNLRIYVNFVQRILTIHEEN